MTLTQIKPAGLSKPVDLADNEKIRLGTGNDLEIYHDGNNSIISDSGTGDLVLKTNGAKIAFTTGGGTEIAEFVNNGACNLRHQSTSRLTTTSTGVNILGSDTTGSNLNGDLVINNAAGTRYAVFDASHTKLNFSNDADATFGDSNDLKIYHTSTGNSSYIINSTGNLNIGSNNEIRLKGGDDVAEHMGRFIDNGAVELYYDASKKFETQSTGAKVTGQLNFDDGSSTANTNGIGFGSSQDCRVFHDGSSFQIRNVTGPVTCITPSFFRLAADSSNDTMFKAIQDGAVELYYDNTKRIETNTTGAFVTGELGCDTLYMGDNEKAKFGNNDDLQIYHSGSDSFIDEAGAGDLKIRSTNGNGIQLISGTSENMITCAKDGSVELYEDGTKRIETTTSGANIVGNLTLSGTVDGRDVASDGSKLDGIESGATADQSASEILTLIKTVDGSGSGLDADTLDGISSGSFVRSDADDTMAANLTIDNGTSTTLSVKCDNSGLALIRANGDGQGTGAVEVGQANTYGGGIAYNGDGSPSFADGESADHIIFYRLDNGTRTEVFHYPYNGNTVNFNSTPTVGGVSLVKTNDTIAQATNASTLDSIDSSSFVRSDTDDTLAGIYTLTNTNRDCFNFSGSASDDNRGIAFNGRIALSADQNDGWLRLNNASEFGSGVYTPGIIRADNGFRVDSTTVIDGSGNIAYARLTGTPTIPTNNNQLTNGAGYITSASFSDVAGGGTFTGDIALSGGAAAMTVNAGSDIRFTSGDWTGNSCKIQHHNSILYIVGGNSGIIFRESGTDRAKIDGSGHFCPATDNTYTLGTSSLRWQDVYTNDLNLSNEGSSNKVDNTWGDYTIQEGADDLFIINNRNGKMFKFMLQEVK